MIDRMVRRTFRDDSAYDLVDITYWKAAHAWMVERYGRPSSMKSGTGAKEFIDPDGHYDELCSEYISLVGEVKDRIYFVGTRMYGEIVYWNADIVDDVGRVKVHDHIFVFPDVISAIEYKLSI